MSRSLWGGKSSTVRMPSHLDDSLLPSRAQGSPSPLTLAQMPVAPASMDEVTLATSHRGGRGGAYVALEEFCVQRTDHLTSLPRELCFVRFPVSRDPGAQCSHATVSVSHGFIIFLPDLALGLLCGAGDAAVVGRLLLLTSLVLLVCSFPALLKKKVSGWNIIKYSEHCTQAA